MNTKPVQEFITRSEENLRIAEAVAEAMPGVREKLAVGFLIRLDARMQAALPGWKSYRDKGFFIASQATYSISKPSWNGGYGIALQFSDRGRRIVFGVCRDKGKLGNRPLCDELIIAMRRIHPAAINHEWWEAQIPMERPAADWRKQEELWRMHSDEGFLNDVSDQLLEVARISEPFVDELVEKNRKSSA